MNSDTTFAGTAPAIRYGWIFGPRADIACMFAPVLFAVAIFAVSQTNPVLQSAVLSAVAAQAIGLSPFHLGSTWIHYFDKVNLSHYWSAPKRMVFFGGPAIVLLMSILLQMYIPALAI